MEFQPVIGIEIHCELKTKTKMFSSSPIDFSSLPNTNVTTTDLAFPGTLPVVNKKAVEMALMACGALQMQIDPIIVFDRKNYFYSDLPKGYQITQDSNPIGRNGFVEINLEDGTFKKIRINRLHMEEDTAKQLHFDDYTLIDYNRSGIPLIEIVSEPDLRSAQEACKYIENIRLTLLYLGVSDVKMEEGSLRCDVNISVMPKGSEVFGTRTEIKNLNSISNVEKAINYEIKRQIEFINNGQKVIQETRRYDEKRKETVSMRIKNDSVDYKYFREPNLSPIYLDEKFIKQILNLIPTLPDERRKKYINVNKLNRVDADSLLVSKEISDYFDKCLSLINEPILISNWILGDVFAYLNANGLSINSSFLTPHKLTDLIKAQVNNEVSSKQAKEILDILLTKDTSVLFVVEEKGFKQVSDTSFILNLVNEVLNLNNESIIAYKAGKTNVLGFLVGKVMKLSKGQANPALTSILLKEEIEKRN